LPQQGLFLGMRFAPALLTPPFVARVERTPPRLSLAAIYCCEAAAFGILALLVHHFSLAAVIVLATVDGTLALAGRALTRAVTATMLEPAGELRSGNAILNICFTGGAAVGPAVAGLVVAGLGIQSALLLDAVSFFLIAGLMVARPTTAETGRWRRRPRCAPNRRTRGRSLEGSLPRRARLHRRKGSLAPLAHCRRSSDRVLRGRGSRSR